MTKVSLCLGLLIFLGLGLGLGLQLQLAYSQAPVTELGTEVNEIDLPDYSEGKVIGDTDIPEATEIQIVEIDDPILEDVQYLNYTLDLDVMTYFNCLMEESLPLYELSDQEETDVDFRAQHTSIYIGLMEACLYDQWILTPEGQQQP